MVRCLKCVSLGYFELVMVRPPTAKNPRYFDNMETIKQSLTSEIYLRASTVSFRVPFAIHSRDATNCSEDAP